MAPRSVRKTPTLQTPLKNFYIMDQKFPFNHFLKLDSFQETPATSSVNPNLFQAPEKTAEMPSKTATGPMGAKIEQEFTIEELKAMTEALLDNLRGMVNPNKFQAFFANTFTVGHVGQDTVEVMVTTSFIKKMIETHYLEIIAEGLQQILGKSYKVDVQVFGTKSSLSSNKENLLNNINPVKQMSFQDEVIAPRRADSVKESTFFINDLNPTKEDQMKMVESQVVEHREAASSSTTHIDNRKLFENFIVGPSNNMAYSFALAVAKEPGRQYPALYLYGNSGLGKTHLIHAIANYIQQSRPQLRIVIISANRFMKELVESTQANKLFEFRKRYTDNVDVLIIDDIHELKDRTGTQNEFFHVFNELTEKGKQLIFTSDKMPKEIVGVEERIKTRLSNALSVEIQQPDLETRIAILKKKAVERDIMLGDDVFNLIAKCVKTNIRDLEGCLIQLGGYSQMMKVDIDLEMARDLLKLNDELEHQKTITIETIAKSVAQHYKIPMGDLRSKTKTKEVVLARHVAMYLIDKLLKPTLKENGNFFSKRDHTTVIHAIQTIKDRMKSDSMLAQQILDIEKQL